MRRILVILIGIILFSITGCSLISVQNQGSKRLKKIPAQPTTSRELEEVLSQEADLNRRVAGEIYATGTEAKSPLSKILLTTSDKILTFHGKPSKPVEHRSILKIEMMHKRFEKAIEAQREREHEWENEVLEIREAAAVANGKLRMSISGLKWWLWCTVVVIIVLCILFPTLIPVFFKWGRKGVTAILQVARRQMRETVKAIQKIRDDENLPTNIKMLIDSHLNAHQSVDTKTAIAKLKKENGIG